MWVDTDGPTFVVGLAEFATDQNGNPTCTETGPRTLSEVSDLLGGNISLGNANFTVPNCPGVYNFVTSSYTWGSNQADLQDPFILAYTLPNGQSDGTGSFTAKFARITVTPATQSGPNSPLTATASLINPPAGATGYNWTITGGGGAIVFPNGQETMSSTTNSITVEEPNPTGSIVQFNVSVVVTTTGSPALEYGPLEDTFGGVTVNRANLWNNQISVTLSGNSSDSGVLNISLVGSASTYSFQYGTAAVGPGTYNVTMNRPNIPADTYTYINATWNASTTVSGSLGIKWKVLGVIRHSQYNTPYESSCTGSSSPAWIINTNSCAYLAQVGLYDPSVYKWNG